MSVVVVLLHSSGVKSVKCCEMRPHEDQFNSQPFADVTAKAAHSLQLF